MKILHIIYTQGVSGAEKHLKYLLPGLKKHGINCEVLILCPPACISLLSSFSNELINADVNSTIISIKNNVSFNTLKVVKNFILDNNFLIVHSHLLRTDLIVSLVKQFYITNLYIISTKHGYQEKVLINYDPAHPIIKRSLIYYITKYTFSKINKNISISKCISQLFINLKLTKQFFPVIYHGVDVAEDLSENILLYKKASVQLIIVGRLEEYKGHIYALKAFKIISSIYPDINLLFLGEGSLKESLKKAATELGIGERVLFLGFQTHVYSYITHSDLIIIPSIFEPFGLVFIEAMALRTPIVAFDVPAGNELLRNNITAILSPKCDITQLAQNILDLLKDKLNSKQIAENAFIDYQENFTCDIMIKNTANFYKKLRLLN